MQNLLRCFVVVSVVGAPALSRGADLIVTAVNKLNLARANQTIELTARQLEPLGAKELNTIHVKDSAGQELIALTHGFRILRLGARHNDSSARC